MGLVPPLGDRVKRMTRRTGRVKLNRNRRTAARLNGIGRHPFYARFALDRDTFAEPGEHGHFSISAANSVVGSLVKLIGVLRYD